MAGQSAHAHGHDQAGHSEGHGGHDHGEGHHVNYVKIWAVLLVLLVISLAGPELGNPIITLVTAFGIALVKAYMVCAYFMHLKFEKKYISYLLATTVAFVLLFFTGVAPDVMKHEGQQWTNDAAEAEVHRAQDAIKARNAAHPGGHH